ncbi:hypothetical protein [Hoyosella subflava]|uniref:Uncharacterized protein n=1 Tax=Hoyosella subflava (strain DSM 45089 / JCM 17490 / NBRC 109087 / DQS3-9A1) TaxID=443218 RepID=F6EHE8_HOYSD|nr:hypothetical protein [Hoyosella subflava]AEF41127.1 hypothetical protein AS9A_2680 [Hoyosella subflava DQS3-9A1]
MLEQSPQEVADALHAWTAMVHATQRGTAIPFVTDGLTTPSVLSALLAQQHRTTV